MSIVKNNLLLEQVQNLEQRVEKNERENNLLMIKNREIDEKRVRGQNQIEKLDKQVKELNQFIKENSSLDQLKQRVDHLNETNSVYQGKINKLKSQLNKMETSHREELQNKQTLFNKLKRDYTDLQTRFTSRQESTLKLSKLSLLSSNTKMKNSNVILPGEHEAVIEYYKQLETKLLDTKQLNMRLRNRMLELQKKHNNRSKSLTKPKR